jgi:hypothetical protein
MLENLGDIDWKNLRHAYGSAKDVPKLIRALAESRENQEETLAQLFTSICHQGTVYQASAYAVPFLMELAMEPTIHRRDEIVGLIAAIAGGNSFLDVHARPDYEIGRNMLKQSGFKNSLRKELDYVESARDAVFQQRNALISLLADSNPMVRAGAVHALCEFSECARELSPALVNAVKKETDALATAGMLWCLGTLGGNSKEVRELLDRTLRTADDPRRSFAAAIALHRMTGRRPRAAEPIYSAMRAATWFLEEFLNGVPWHFRDEADLAGLVSKVAPDGARGTEMLLQVLSDPTTHWRVVASVVHDLLDINFPDGDWRTGSTLTQTQRCVIECLVNSDSAWLDARRLWFLIPNGAMKLSKLSAKDVNAVRKEMRAKLNGAA